MRFRGGGVSHKSTRGATDFFKNDRDCLDKQTVTATQVEEDDEEDPIGAYNIEDEKEDYGYEREDTDSDEDETGVDDDFETFAYAEL